MTKEVATTGKDALTKMLHSEKVMGGFKDILADRAPAFISSILSATKAVPKLLECTPQSIISSAVIAATLDLPIQQNLGFAYIIPYGKEASFQIGYKGFIQLAMRSGQYKTINACEVYEGELVKEDRFTGEYVFDTAKKKSAKIEGYMAHIKLLNGFEKTLYMTSMDMEKHAKKYSKTYAKNFGNWKDDFDAMALKTVIKMVLSKFGILSVKMETALTTDQSVVRDTETLDVDYVDNDQQQTFEQSPEEAVKKAEEKSTIPAPKGASGGDAIVLKPLSDQLKGGLLENEAFRKDKDKRKHRDLEIIQEIMDLISDYGYSSTEIGVSLKEKGLEYDDYSTLLKRASIEEIIEVLENVIEGEAKA